jgi:hypothetical protein
MRLETMRSQPTAWRRSSYCASGECAEVTKSDNSDNVLVRSTLAPQCVLSLTTAEWRALRLGIQAGEFDDLG